MRELWRKPGCDSEGTRAASAIRLLRTELKAQGWRYPCFVVCNMLFTLAALLPPRLFLFYTNHLASLGVAATREATEFLHTLLLFGLLVALVMLVEGLASIVVEEWMCLRLEAHLRLRALRAIHLMPMDELDVAQRGDWLTRVSGDLRSVEQFIATTIPGHLRSILTLLAVTLILSLHSLALAVVMVCSAVALALVNVLVQRQTQPELDRIRELHGQILQSLLENFEGVPSIRSLGAETKMLAWFGARVDAITSSSLRVMRTIGLLVGGNSAATYIFFTLCLAGSALTLHHGSVRLEEALAVPFYIGMFYHAALSLTGAAVDWSRFLANAGRLAELLERPAYGAAGSVCLPASLAVRVLQLNEVMVAVEGRKPLSHPFDFSLRIGQLLVIQGPSGCGKSTFLQMLSGLRPFAQGALRLEGGRGSLAAFSRARPLAGAAARGQKLWIPRELCAYVEQRPFLFESSVRDNLTLGMPTPPTDDELWAGLESLSLDTLVASRGGLDALLADHGKNLSEGQKYRLALVRALLGSRPFLLLDEPFSALDESSAALVCRAMDRLRAGCGIVIVSHVIPQDLHSYDLLDFAALSPVPEHPAQGDMGASKTGSGPLVGLAPSLMVPP